MGQVSLVVRLAAKFRVALIVAVALAATAAAAYAANLTGGSNSNTIIGTPNNDNISDGNGMDDIWGLGGSDSINAGTGQDVIDAGGKCPPGQQGMIYNGRMDSYCQHGPQKPCGSDNINASSGMDVVWGNCGSNTINLGGGQDTVYAYGGPNTINVGNGSDTIYLYDTNGAGKRSNLRTGTGSDVVRAQNGVVDTINCGSPHTTVYADKTDKTSNCTVKYTSQSTDKSGATRPRHRPSRRRAESKR